MNLRTLQRAGAWIPILWLTGTLASVQGQEIRTLDYLVASNNRVSVIRNGETNLLDRELTLNPQLTVLTNGVVKITGAPDQKLPTGRKLTLDGFWLNDDGMLAQFPPHYIQKDRVLYFVKDGEFQKVDQDVAFPNGVSLRADGTVLMSNGTVLRLLDGQCLSAAGATLPAWDHIMMINGKLVLQKDGSIIGLPAGTMGMSDGTKVTPSGLVTTRAGEQIALKDGQRLTVPGAAMPQVQ